MQRRGIIFLLLGSVASAPALAAPDAPLKITVYPLPASMTAPPPDVRRDQLYVIPGNVSVIDDSQWKQTRAMNLKDMLDFTPGVFVQPRNGAEAARISIRGSGLSRTFQGRGLWLMQDDIPVNTADGSFDFQMIDPWLIRYSEVLRGANAMPYGSSTLGGLINFVMPTGYDSKGGLRAEAGSFDTGHALLSRGGQDNQLDYFGALTGFHQDGFRRQNTQDSARFAGNTGWRFSPDLESRFYIHYINSKAEIPGTLTKSQLNANPKRANTANINGNFLRDLQTVQLANKTAWTAGAGRFTSTVFWSYRNLDNPATVYILNHGNDVGARLRYTQEGWTAGFNTQYGDLDETRWQNLLGNPGNTVVTREEQASTSELYAQYERELAPKWHGSLGAQASYATRNIEEIFPGPASQHENYIGFSPAAGLRYQWNEAMQLFTNISRSFEPPTLSELSGGNSPGFQKLSSQRATTAEIGSRGKRSSTTWEMSYYHAWLDNEFITFRMPDASTATINAGTTQHDGIELGGTQQLAKDWSLQLAYTWSYFRQHGERLPGIPEHYVRSALHYDHPSGWSFAPDVEWVPLPYPIDMARTFDTSPYAVIGVSVGYAPPGTPYSFYVEGRNLLDRTYIATTGVIPNAFGNDQNQFYPGDGRAVYAGIKINW